ncbi:MAG TPA: TIGR02453 family protein [Candidatus Krumholzibacteria bacterium]|nr:TIGR02453 family protein [Candidatus Krumholzibacteria bacterium]
MADRHFTPALFAFLRDLKANNDRAWFAENRDRWLADVRDPCLRFITDLGAPLMAVSPAFRADPRPQGGSMFRLHRDIRFSKDKSPFKTAVGLHFRHENGRDAHTPGFYLQLEPGNCFAAVGLWRPDGPSLKLVRDRLAADPDSWRRAVGGKAFKAAFEVSGESLVRVPRGYPADHPLAEQLKLKDITAWAPLTQKQVTSEGFLDGFAGLCRTGGSLVQWICGALGQPY